MAADVPKDSRWRERETGRVARILEEEVHGTGPSYTYEDEPGSWHYANLCDWVLWDRWERVL
jgi:hypothetical protein